MSPAPFTPAITEYFCISLTLLYKSENHTRAKDQVRTTSHLPSVMNLCLLTDLIMECHAFKCNKRCVSDVMNAH